MTAAGLLAGKVVLVSGVGPGLGRSCAAAALAAGASVVVGDLDAARLDGIADELDPLMGRGASVVVIGSIGAVRPRATTLRMSYGASKGALVTAARYLATELGALGIRVNTVAPGWKWGPVLARYVDHLVATTGRTADEVLETFRGDTVLHDLAADDDVADSVVFFLSDLSRKVSGQVLHVDGGGFIP